MDSSRRPPASRRIRSLSAALASHVARPASDATDNRDNPKGMHYERWWYAYGCGRWFNVARLTVTDEIIAVYQMGVYQMGERRPTLERARATQTTAREECAYVMTAVTYLRSSGARATFTDRAVSRKRPVRFRFDGRPFVGYAGDSLASALLANGLRIIARSFKFHQPRGVYTRSAAWLGVEVCARHPREKSARHAVKHAVQALSRLKTNKSRAYCLPIRSRRVRSGPPSRHGGGLTDIGTERRCLPGPCRYSHRTVLH
jgi:sarcosine oxidase delta subunit